jgi:hypothetical protein
VLGVEVARAAADFNILSQLLGLLLGIFAIGLLRSWQLLGAPYESSLESLLGALLVHKRHDVATNSDDSSSRPHGFTGETATAPTENRQVDPSRLPM